METEETKTSNYEYAHVMVRIDSASDQWVFGKKIIGSISEKTLHFYPIAPDDSETWELISVNEPNVGNGSFPFLTGCYIMYTWRKEKTSGLKTFAGNSIKKKTSKKAARNSTKNSAKKMSSAKKKLVKKTIKKPAKSHGVVLLGPGSQMRPSDDGWPDDGWSYGRSPGSSDTKYSSGKSSYREDDRGGLMALIG